jgi:hypothetical protein
MLPIQSSVIACHVPCQNLLIVATDESHLQTEDGQPRDPRVVVQSEDQPERLLLETKIVKEDGFQKQQGTSRDFQPQSLYLTSVRRDVDCVD